jgi:NDP-sugar pyrophosphorylase family protein
MIAIILAGGFGERLKPLTNKIPKPMAEVGGKPVLLHILNLLKNHGIKDFIFALCYLPEKIVSYFGDGSKFGVNISYTYENPNKPLSTAGAITLSKNIIKEKFIVTAADILDRNLDVADMINQHEKTKALGTLNVYRHPSNDTKSLVEFDENNKISKFIERPSEEIMKEEFVWSNGSFYILEPEIFDWIESNEKSDFGKDIFPKLLKAGKPIYAYPTKDHLTDIGYPETLEKAQKKSEKDSK